MRVLSIRQDSPEKFPRAYIITFNDVTSEDLQIASHSLATGAECCLAPGEPIEIHCPICNKELKHDRIHFCKGKNQYDKKDDNRNRSR